MKKRLFSVPEEASRVAKMREFKTVDIVKRIGVITANRVSLENYPVNNPVTIFNPSIQVEEDIVKLYARIVLGYFTYASSVAYMEIPLSNLNEEYINKNNYSAEIIVYPSIRYDFWGVEDPRVYRIDDKLLMTYSGRTVNYFNPAIRTERTLLVTASFEGEKWKKFWVFRLPEGLRGFIISDKDGFIVKVKNKFFIFHRPHLTDEKYYLTISKLPNNLLQKTTDRLEEVLVNETVVAMEPADFESKLGWATPPIPVGKEYLILLHGVCKEIECYRVLAVLVSCEDLKVTAVTPHYIMEPKMTYEIYGDRPYTVFPCGIQRIDDKLIVSYGAADSAIGIGEIDLSELLSILDKNRLE